MSHYALLHTKYSFRRFLKVFPHYKEANDRPSWNGQVGSKSMVGTVYAGDHKTLIYKRFFFHYKSMRAIDHHGLSQFAPKGLG